MSPETPPPVNSNSQADASVTVPFDMWKRLMMSRGGKQGRTAAIWNSVEAGASLVNDVVCQTLEHV